MSGMSQDDPYSWLTKIAPIATPLAMAWAVIRGYFALVTRKEMQQTLMAIERQRAEERREVEAMHAKRHEETQAAFRELFGRMGGVEQRIAGVEGEMRARAAMGAAKHDG